MKRCCIVGTAQSWRETPWNDPSLEIFSLNDAYQLGFPRADRWFEIHPLDKLWYRPDDSKIVRAEDVPKGFFIRPKDHLAWLKKQAETIPVYLQEMPPADWPANARRFPFEQVFAQFGDDYWASGPSYMLALAFMEGYQEIWISGIHLATESEYREQRPQFESLISQLLGPNVKKSKKNGFRFYDGHVRIVLPESSPIMQHGWKYALEPKPVAPPNPYREELALTVKAKQELVKALIQWPVGKDKAHAIERLRRLEIIELDCQQMLAKASVSSGVIKAALQVAA